MVFAQGLSETTPMERLIISLEGYVGRKEREYMVRRSIMRKVGVAKSGRLPCGESLFGDDRDPVLKKRTIKEAEAAVVRDSYHWIPGGVAPPPIGPRLKENGIRGRRSGVL